MELVSEPKCTLKSFVYTSICNAVCCFVCACVCIY